MQNWQDIIKGKKITVVGLGLLGRGVGDVAFLAEHGADLIVTDLKDADALAPSLEKLKQFPHITYTLGEHRLEDFQNRDFILKGPNVPVDSPYIQEAQKEGTPIKMSASWFAELANIPVIGVTGTRGKSTVTHMLYDILQAAGKEVLLGGNVRGVSTLALLPQVTEKSIALMELDSWQCWGFGAAQVSPHIAVFTSFFPDHMDYYQSNMDAYLADKAQIFLHQTPDDTLVMSEQVAPLLTEHYDNAIIAKRAVAPTDTLPENLQLKVPGEHNRANAACALNAARAAGVDDALSVQALADFAGVPGRLECIREINGIAFYNDTTATTPEATLAALHTLTVPHDGRPTSVILIIGGSDKGLSMSALTEALPRYTKRVVYLAGSGTERILPQDTDATLHNTLESAVNEAYAAAEPGDTILFSPAFASFGMFTNEFDRGDQFTTLVRAL
ncbi:MAG: UDP-N-acetylmuramoyl-L-alanine--D-glutamate ligase [Patescibacteria group bacterium UBA2163]